MTRVRDKVSKYVEFLDLRLCISNSVPSSYRKLGNSVLGTLCAFAILRLRMPDCAFALKIAPTTGRGLRSRGRRIVKELT